ncbi:MAG: B12-binding domain-containing radical SAM protein [Sedimentisphaerales bacterium]|nr:B12-binding domain-containing radical SAM protein [Sedimentisphaerales bacterium]
MNDYVCLQPGDPERRRTRILLVYPKVGSEARGVSLYPPLSLLYLAACLKEYSVAIFDQRVDDPGRFADLLGQEPLCVGFSIMTGPQIRHALELAGQAKQRGIPTVFGGVHATILPEQTQADPNVDYVVSGEGEDSFRRLIESLSGKRSVPAVIRDGQPDLNCLSDLPYELVDAEQYVISSAIEGRSLPVLFSRGCPFACTFCCNPVITGRRWRTMDVDRAIGQLDRLVETYRLDSVIFWDENLFVNPAILHHLADSIQGRFGWFAQSRANALLQYDLNHLEAMGVRRFSCGLESGSPAILKKIRKQETVEEYLEANRRLARTGISVWYNYIIAWPFETLEDLKLTVQLAVRILEENPHAQNSTFYLLTPYPGTQIGDQYYADFMPQSLAAWSDFGRHNFAAPYYEPERVKLYERICFSSKFVGRKILALFPDDSELNELVEIMTHKWKHFDFSDDAEWETLQIRAWDCLQRLFGENAY